MSHLPDAARLAAAKSRFQGFFREIGDAFAEREDVVTQLALAVLAREHVLLAGPPGTAKSALASAVLGRILDEDTGRPSLYARQLTESTVQTDVIGPLDFKTLMETGRTEHFTDEGLLGAVHAFLDEVFDGRDMLLRSTLNLLHERELKQGTRITRGRFEVAVMTTNRYVAEVLESARETLLAFVDRIAFVGFVPRGFASPSRLEGVLRHAIGGAGRAVLEAPLTVQDVDALQRLVDAVHVPDELCDGLAKLLDLLEGELSAAERADPTFTPTRYLSTRTAVRSGRILRAICVHDMIFRRPDRPLSVEPADLRALRLHLLLSGPSPDEVAALLQRERDPREKRQLAILRHEREAFERAFAKLPAIRVPTHRPPPPRDSAPSPRAATAPPPAAAPAGPPAWSVSASNALALGEPSAMVAALREVLPHAGAEGDHAELAEALLRKGLTMLERRALQVTLAARAEDTVSLRDVARQVAELAATLDQGPAKAQALARRVRGWALVLVSTDPAAALELGQVNLIAWVSERDAMALLRDAEQKLGRVESLAALRAGLVAAGVDPRSRHDADAAWSKGLATALDEITALCDAALRTAATSALANGEASNLGKLLGDVGAVLELLRDLEARAVALGAPASLQSAVVGPRISPLLAHTFGRFELRGHAAYLAELDRARSVLERAGLADVVPPSDWLTWAARALMRAEVALGDAPAPAPTHDGYRELRGRGSRVPHAFVLAEVALRTAPASPPGLGAVGERAPSEEAAGGSTREPAAADLSAVATLIATLPDGLARDLAAADLRRVGRVVSLLESFWEAIEGPSEIRSAEAAAERLHHIVTSRFFAILLDDGAAARTLLEIDLVRELFPGEAEAAKALTQRVEDLVARARRRVLALVRLRGESAWTSALHRASGGGSA